MPFGTTYLYVLAHISSCMFLTFRKGASEVSSTASGISGGRFATRTRFFPKPATAKPTVDSSPLWCMYFASPLVSISSDCTQSLLINLINTCLLMPSIWIIVTFCSRIRNVLWIPSWMSNTVIFGLAEPELHTMVLSRSAIIYQHFTSSHSLVRKSISHQSRTSFPQFTSAGKLCAPLTTFPVRSA